MLLFLLELDKINDIGKLHEQYAMANDPYEFMLRLSSDRREELERYLERDLVRKQDEMQASLAQALQESNSERCDFFFKKIAVS